MASIFDMISKPVVALAGKSSDRLAATVARLTEGHAVVAAEAERLRVEFESLLADRAIEEQPLDDAVVAKAKTAASAAQERASALAAALTTARARLSAAQADETRAALRSQWDQAIALADDRQQAVEKLDEAIATFAAAYTHLGRLNAELEKALPAIPDRFALVIGRSQIEAAVRMALVKAGAAESTTEPKVSNLAWAIAAPWGVHSIPPLLDAFAGVPDLVRSWAPKA